MSIESKLKSSSQTSMSIPKPKMAAGFLAPLAGRRAMHDVKGPLGFALVHKGEPITEAMLSRAQSMGKLYEVIAAAAES